jgi:hypothetical protein
MAVELPWEDMYSMLGIRESDERAELRYVVDHSCSVENVYSDFAAEIRCMGEINGSD